MSRLVRCIAHALAIATAAGAKPALAQNAGPVPDSVQSAALRAPIDSATAHRLLFAPMNAVPRTPLPASLPPFAPRDGGSRMKSTLTWAAIGGLIGAVGGYELFKPGPNDCDTCMAIAEGTAIEGAVLGLGVGAAIGGLIGYIRGGN